MILEAFKVIKGVRPFYLLTIFLALSMLAGFEKVNFLDEPLNLYSLFIPLAVFFASIISWLWVDFIIGLCHLLPKNDSANLGYFAACSVMVLAVLITFSYFSSDQQGIELGLLGTPGFIYTCTLYLASMVAFDVASS